MNAHRQLVRTLAIFALLASGSAIAGGLVELPGNFDGSSNNVTNPWWPLVPGQRSIYLEDSEDECGIIVIDVIPTATQYRASVNGVVVREILDRAFVDESGAYCEDGSGSIDDWELLEITLDWYAQDVAGNAWYFGEHSVATDHEECDHPTDGVDGVLGIEGCLDGSWEAGYDIWADEVDEDILAGVIMLANPKKGQFYFQEFWEDEAEDMGKVLKFKAQDSAFYGELSNCMVTKDWVPLEPGSIEHKIYCYGYGLIAEEGKSGGKTSITELVDVINP